MLTSLANIRLIPAFSSTAQLSDAWGTALVTAADAAIKKFLKRDIELTSYTEYYSGSGRQDLVLNQYPVYCGTTTIASGSNGATLPQSTIYVASTANFAPSTGTGTPTLSLQTSVNTWTTITYSGVTSTTFTGCSGGSGTLSSATGLNQVFAPTVYYDMGGYFGQNPNGFSTGTQMVIGSQFVIVLDKGGTKSNRGLLRKIGGGGGGGGGTGSGGPWVTGYTGGYIGGSKLGAWRLPGWSYGDGNIKVQYSAGYDTVPYDLTAACNMLVGYMARNMPSGAALGSESLGAYSYSVLTQSNDVPEIGSLLRSLIPYRESSW